MRNISNREIFPTTATYKSKPKFACARFYWFFLFIWLQFIDLIVEVQYFHFGLADCTKWNNVKRILVFRDLQKRWSHLRIRFWKNGVAMCHNGVISYQNYYKFLHKPRKHKYWLLSWHRHLYISAKYANHKYLFEKEY